MDTNVDYILSVIKIIFINLILSGDNAVVIALAARNLPAPRRRTVIIGGGVLAVAMQSAFVLLVSRLMAVPGLPVLGALLLMAIACKLLQEDEACGETEAGSATRASILRIALANLVMSFDNVLAVASTCRSDPVRMIFGLVVSIAVIFAFSTLIIRLMRRLPWIAHVGAALLAATAAGMIWPELGAAVRWTQPSLASAHLGLVLVQGLRWTFTGLIVLGCLSSPWWWPGGS